MRMMTLLWVLGACATTPATPPATPAASAPAVATVTTSSEEAGAAYERALSAQDNFRIVDAIHGYEEALAADTDFALAKARLGSLVPGNDGMEWLRLAAADAVKQGLPAAETALIGALVAFAEGDQAQGNALMARVASLAPGEWRAHLQVGTAAYFREDFSAATVALEQAVALQPAAGPAWNMLGYTRAELGDTDGAVAAFDKYAALAPGEANPHDSAGEILMRSGRYEEAEARFDKAVKADTGFFLGWVGIAQTRFLRGDWAGGHGALAEAATAAPRATDKVFVRTAVAWAHAAKGDRDAAEAELAAAESDALEASLHTQHTFLAVTLGNLRALLGDAEGAADAHTLAEQRAAEGELPPGAARTAKAAASLGRAYALARADDAAAAAAAMPDVEALLSQQPGIEPAVRLAEGAIELAGGNAAAAVEALSKCGRLQYRCRLDLAEAQAASGDEVGAAATRAAITALNARGPDYLVVLGLAADQP